jgi:hypothetical protein
MLLVNAAAARFSEAAVDKSVVKNQNPSFLREKSNNSPCADQPRPMTTSLFTTIYTINPAGIEV